MSYRLRFHELALAEWDKQFVTVIAVGKRDRHKVYERQVKKQPD